MDNKKELYEMVGRGVVAHRKNEMKRRNFDDIAGGQQNRIDDMKSNLGSTHLFQSVLNKGSDLNNEFKTDKGLNLLFKNNELMNEYDSFPSKNDSQFLVFANSHGYSLKDLSKIEFVSNYRFNDIYMGILDIFYPLCSNPKTKQLSLNQLMGNLPKYNVINKFSDQFKTLNDIVIDYLRSVDVIDKNNDTTDSFNFMSMQTIIVNSIRNNHSIAPKLIKMCIKSLGILPENKKYFGIAFMVNLMPQIKDFINTHNEHLAFTEQVDDILSLALGEFDIYIRKIKKSYKVTSKVPNISNPHQVSGAVSTLLDKLDNFNNSIKYPVRHGGEHSDK